MKWGLDPSSDAVFEDMIVVAKFCFEEGFFALDEAVSENQVDDYRATCGYHATPGNSESKEPKENTEVDGVAGVLVGAHRDKSGRSLHGFAVA